MLVAGEGRAPNREHLMALAKKVDLKHARGSIDEFEL